MPLFIFIGRDAPDAVERRKQHRPRHLEYLEQFSRGGRIAFAGPLKDEAGVPCGSLYVLEATDLADAKTLTSRDPYLLEGVFHSVELFETMQVLPVR